MSDSLPIVEFPEPPLTTLMAHRLAFEELRQGLVYTTGLTPRDYHVREPASRQLAERVVAQLRAEGKIH